MRKPRFPLFNSGRPELGDEVSAMFGSGQHFSVKDTSGKEIKVGTRVKFYDSEFTGIVTRITDIDGDVDDDGRSRMIPPQVVVKYDRSGTEKYWTDHESGWWGHAGETMEFVCEDVDVIQNWDKRDYFYAALGNIDLRISIWRKRRRNAKALKELRQDASEFFRRRS